MRLQTTCLGCGRRLRPPFGDAVPLVRGNVPKATVLVVRCSSGLAFFNVNKFKTDELIDSVANYVENNPDDSLHFQLF